MKAGTTTIHHILNNHPDIFIPNLELHFWDSDDILEHPDFDYFDGNQWVQSCVTRGQQRKWYKEQFLQAASGQIVGEDSKTYVSSTLFADRISQFCCNTKIVVCLRDPSDRAYSQYWHILRYGRLPLTFEKTV